MTRAEPPSAFEAFEPEIDMPLDPGIRRAVLILRSAGVETMESCEGGPGHAFPEPTVRFNGDAWAGYKAFAIAMEHGLPVMSLRRAYGVTNGQLEGPWWELTFHTTALESEGIAMTPVVGRVG
jgi:hypothetical protein